MLYLLDTYFIFSLNLKPLISMVFSWFLFLNYQVKNIKITGVMTQDYNLIIEAGPTQDQGLCYSSNILSQKTKTKSPNSVEDCTNTCFLFLMSSKMSSCLYVRKVFSYQITVAKCHILKSSWFSLPSTRVMRACQCPAFKKQAISC